VTWCFFRAHACSFFRYNWLRWVLFCFPCFSWLFLSRIFNYMIMMMQIGFSQIYSDKNDQFYPKDIYFFINRNDRISRIINIYRVCHHNRSQTFLYMYFMSITYHSKIASSYIKYYELRFLNNICYHFENANGLGLNVLQWMKLILLNVFFE